MKYEPPMIKIRKFEAEEYLVASSAETTKAEDVTSSSDGMGEYPDSDMF